MNRRDFIKLTGTASLSALLSGWPQGWVFSNPTSSENTKRLIVIFLRGAVDGLSVVIPYSDPNYYKIRSKIAIPRPGHANGALDLDGIFALHPTLSPLLPLWKNGQLAFVQAAGSPDPSRSHFDAQDYMESGTPGLKVTSTGWMNRLLSLLPQNGASIRAINFGETLPIIFSGPEKVAIVPIGKKADRPMAVDRPVVAKAFEKLYENDPAMAEAYREGIETRRDLVRNNRGLSDPDPQKEMEKANRGATPASKYGQFGVKLAQIVNRDPGVQLGFLALGGWDTHVNQGGSEGQLANNLRSLGQGLADFVNGMGSMMNDTVVMVISEFGRTVRENGNGGSDHGHGNVIWVLGGPVQGKKNYGDWTGLNAGVLYEGRDLPVTTDFRNVIAQIIKPHLNISDQNLATVFPQFTFSSANVGGLIKS